jgi:hypothetical protein
VTPTAFVHKLLHFAYLTFPSATTRFFSPWSALRLVSQGPPLDETPSQFPPESQHMLPPPPQQQQWRQPGGGAHGGGSHEGIRGDADGGTSAVREQERQPSGQQRHQETEEDEQLQRQPDTDPEARARATVRVTDAHMQTRARAHAQPVLTSPAGGAQPSAYLRAQQAPGLSLDDEVTF